MAYTRLGHTEIGDTSGLNQAVTTASQDTTGADLIVVNLVFWANASASAPGITDNKGNTFLAADTLTSDGATQERFWYCQNPTVGTGHTFTGQAVNAGYPNIEVMWFSGSASSPVDQTNSAVNTGSGVSQAGSITPTQDNELIVFGYSLNAGIGSAKTIDSGMSSPTDFIDYNPGNSFGGGMSYKIQTTAAAINPALNSATSVGNAHIVSFKAAAAAGIAFDVAANSGDQAAASTYSGSASWNGTNRMLAIDVSLLGAGVTVTSMTYGGANCTFIGSKSTVTSLGSVEQWRITSSDAGAPGTGANTLVVNLSSTIEFSVEWVSYTGVHQTSPTEAFNSAQATNTGSATDASVVITTASDNCWVHGAVVANDTSITANQTSRNNISGTLGSGANEDNNAAKTPPGAVTMSYTGMGITTTWAIAGYAIRPIADPALVTAINKFLMLMGVGS